MSEHLCSMKSIYAYALLLLLNGSCKKKSDVNQAEVDQGIITQYIADNNLTTAKATGSGLYYVVTTQGQGLQPNATSNVTVKYKGMLTNGSVFDETSNIGLAFNLGGVIKGWQEGIPLFNKGGKGKLLIPSALGYGNQAQPKIPANSVLIFDVELLDVK
jgi:FKBP-type peptidyl-prolyl cis-trans isomerase FkpA